MMRQYLQVSRTTLLRNVLVHWAVIWLAISRWNSVLATYKELHLGDLFVDLLHELNDKVDELVFQHFLCMEIRNQERDVVSLHIMSITRTDFLDSITPTFTGFLLRMKNASALCVKNLVNLCTKICSISSACLILMLTRTLLILGSIKTLSFSLRDMTSGFSKTSGELAASISGTLWRSDAWDAKLARDNAAVREARTHCKYGRSDWDYRALANETCPRRRKTIP